MTFRLQVEFSIMSEKTHSIIFLLIRNTALLFLLILLNVLGFGAGFAIIYFNFDQPKRGIRLDGTKQHHYYFNKAIIDLSVVKTGWSPPLEWGIWSMGTRSVLEFPISTKQLKNIKVSMNYQVFAGCAKEQKIDIFINDNRATQWVYKTYHGFHTKDFTYTLNKKFKAKNLKMRFDILNACSPKELGISKDAKKYSLGIKEIIITTTSLNPEVIVQD